MDDIRARHPTRTPCLIEISGGNVFKLLVDSHSTVRQLLIVVRLRLRYYEGFPSDKAFWLVCGRTMPPMNATLMSLDTDKAHALRFRMVEESVFGGARARA